MPLNENKEVAVTRLLTRPQPADQAVVESTREASADSNLNLLAWVVDEVTSLSTRPIAYRQ